MPPTTYNHRKHDTHLSGDDSHESNWRFMRLYSIFTMRPVTRARRSMCRRIDSSERIYGIFVPERLQLSVCKLFLGVNSILVLSMCTQVHYHSGSKQNFNLASTPFWRILMKHQRLRTVPSLANATAEGQYITHTGACGTCSSLQDLALMIEYDELSYKAQQCFFFSTAVKYVDKAITCYEEIGFTRSCAQTLSYHQRRIVERDCGYQCAAWSFDGDLGRRKSTIVIELCAALIEFRMGISGSQPCFVAKLFFFILASAL